ncbi:MAG TPA: UDP-N-acetylmuramoyl-L-alanine--D-glutamate ligase [Phototrophicaceae bacterium]|nr:UDP-N-acetylmuramoyl-L-alanine--D-glutamate ligase [Phototrophicaceae bacterium]
MSDPLQGKTVVVLGFARQGKALARWLPTIGARVIVNDGKTAEELKLNPAEYPGVEFILGGHPEILLEGANLICVSGGVPLDLPIIQLALRYGVPLTNDAQLFMERCPAPVIGITGSAGKTTTTTLVGNIFKKAGHRTWVGGNIGDVLLNVLPIISPQDRVVMELSSFQLELMTVSPNVGAVLNITPNHLDRHGTMEAYAQAKSHIIIHQKARDAAVLGRDDAVAREFEQIAPGDVIWFSAREMVGDGAFLAGERLILAGDASPDGEPHVICERKDIQLRGDHNVLNVLAACAITGAAGVEPQAMAEAIRAFRGVEHRLETVRVVNGVTYVNDSIATAPERVQAALRSYDEPLILLLGGRDKKLPWEIMLSLALTKSRHMIAFGEFGDGIVKLVKLLCGSEDPITCVKSLDEAVPLAASLAQPGDVVLLSPGGTSYDAYTDFVERGEHFRKLVQAL